MLRLTLSTAAGIALAILVVAAVEMIGHTVYPPPTGIDFSKPEEVARILDRLPLGALGFVVAAWVSGSFAGSALATYLVRGLSIVPGLIVGASVLVVTGFTLIAIPHPLWMAVAGVGLPLPAAWLGARLVKNSLPG